jgi:hypothetical protein
MVGCIRVDYVNKHFCPRLLAAFCIICSCVRSPYCCVLLTEQCNTLVVSTVKLRSFWRATEEARCWTGQSMLPLKRWPIRRRRLVTNASRYLDWGFPWFSSAVRQMQGYNWRKGYSPSPPVTESLRQNDFTLSLRRLQPKQSSPCGFNSQTSIHLPKFFS